MNEPKLKQPVVLGGPCECGDGYAACNMVLAYECTQCGRLEAADDSRKASLEDVSAFAPAHGSASAPAVAEWIRYLLAINAWDSYDGMCDCHQCRSVKNGFEKWRAEQSQNVGTEVETERLKTQPKD